jgi:hypothetical protein
MDCATLGPSELQPASTVFQKRAFTLFFIHSHWPLVRSYTSSFDFAEPYVFGKQSPLFVLFEFLRNSSFLGITSFPEVMKLFAEFL